MDKTTNYSHSTCILLATKKVHFYSTLHSHGVASQSTINARAKQETSVFCTVEEECEEIKCAQDHFKDYRLLLCWLLGFSSFVFLF